MKAWFKKFKEKIDFLKWAYKHRHLQSIDRQMFFYGTTVCPTRMNIERVVSKDELEHFGHEIERAISAQLAEEIAKMTRMEINECIMDGRVVCRKSLLIATSPLDSYSDWKTWSDSDDYKL